MWIPYQNNSEFLTKNSSFISRRINRFDKIFDISQFTIFFGHHRHWLWVTLYVTHHWFIGSKKDSNSKSKPNNTSKKRKEVSCIFHNASQNVSGLKRTETKRKKNCYWKAIWTQFFFCVLKTDQWGSWKKIEENKEKKFVKIPWSKESTSGVTRIIIF